VTIFSLLSVLFRLIGFARLADSFWAKHEAKAAKNVQKTDETLPDDAVVTRLHKYDRD
jgi:hypothetical protein